MSNWCFDYETGAFEHIDRDGFSIERGQFVYNWDDSSYQFGEWEDEQTRDRLDLFYPDDEW